MLTYFFEHRLLRIADLADPKRFTANQTLARIVRFTDWKNGKPEERKVHSFLAKFDCPLNLAEGTKKKLSGLASANRFVGENPEESHRSLGILGRNQGRVVAAKSKTITHQAVKLFFNGLIRRVIQIAIRIRSIKVNRW